MKDFPTVNADAFVDVLFVDIILIFWYLSFSKV